MGPVRAAALLALALVQSRGCEYHWRLGDPPQPEISSVDSEHHSEALPTPAGRLKPPRGGIESMPTSSVTSEPSVESSAPPATPEPTPPAEPTPSVEPTPPAEPWGPVVLRFYRTGEGTADPFGRRRPPRGVELFHTETVGHRTTRTPDRGPIEGGREGGTRISRTAQVHPDDGESLADAIERVRPWFDRLRVADDERFLFHFPRDGGTRDFDRADAFLVSEPPIEVHRSDIHEVGLTEVAGQAHGVVVCWSRQGALRLPPLTRDLTGHEVAFVVDEGVLWAPLIGDAGPIGSSWRDTLVFLNGERAFGERVRSELLRGGDDVQTAPGSPFPCARH